MVEALCGRLQLLYCFFETVIQHEIEENHNQKYNPSDQLHYSSFTGDSWDIPASNTYSEHSQNFSPDIEPCVRRNRLRTDKVLIFVHLQKAFMYCICQTAPVLHLPEHTEEHLSEFGVNDKADEC